MSEERIFIPASGRISNKEGRKFEGKTAKNISARVVKQKNGYFLKWDRRTLEYNQLGDKRIRNVRFFGAVFELPDLWYWVGIKNEWDTRDKHNVRVDFLATMWVLTKQKEDKVLARALLKLETSFWTSERYTNFDADFETVTGEAEQLPDDINLNPRIKKDKFRVTLDVTVDRTKKFANQHTIEIHEKNFRLRARENVPNWKPFFKENERTLDGQIYLNSLAGWYAR